MFKIGIIGAGGIVESCHLPLLKSIDEVEVKWIFDQNANRSILLSQMYGINKVCTDENWKDAINSVDICLLTIPYGARKKYIEEVSAKKKFLYVEKPFAISAAEHLNFCSLFPDYGLSIGFQRRFYAIVWSLKSIIESNIFGKLKEIIFLSGNFSLKGGSGYLSNPALSGGGILIESAIHAFDQILLFTGANEIKLLQHKVLFSEGIEYDSSINATIVGNMGNIYNLQCEISTMRNYKNGLTLHFENATISCELTPQSVICVRTNLGDSYTLCTSSQNNIFAQSVIKSFFLNWNEFFKAINDKTPNLSSGKTSLLTTKFIEQLYAFRE